EVPVRVDRIDGNRDCSPCCLRCWRASLARRRTWVRGLSRNEQLKLGEGARVYCKGGAVAIGERVAAGAAGGENHSALSLRVSDAADGDRIGARIDCPGQCAAKRTGARLQRQADCSSRADVGRVTISVLR